MSSETNRHRYTDRHLHRYKAPTKTFRDTHIADRQTDIQTASQPASQPDRQQTDIQTDSQLDSQTARQTDSASHLILDAKIKLQLEVLNHEVLQAFLDDASQHDAKRETFEQLAAQQDLDGLPLSEQALGPINMLLPGLQTRASPVRFLPFFVLLSVFLFRKLHIIFFFFHCAGAF